MKHAALTVVLATALSSAAVAAPIYRCGPDGRVYSQTPCADGRLIDASDPRSAAQRAEASRVAARERKAADQLERDRREREAAQPAAQATGFNGRPAPPEPAASSAKPAKHKHHKAKPITKDFVAVDPSSVKKKGHK